MMLDRLPTGIVEIESMNQMVKPGETAEVSFGFLLMDEVTSVDIKLQEFLGNESEVLTQTINLEELSN